MKSDAACGEGEELHVLSESQTGLDLVREYKVW